MTTDETIALKSVSKKYRSNQVLNEANLVVKRGQVVALLGENGAGKTTTIRSLMGFLKVDSGTLEVFGLNPWKHANDVRRRVGYVSDDPALYDWMTVTEMGWFCAGFYDAAFGDRFEQLMNEFEVPLKQRIGTLSRGQKARIALSLALAAEPELLILDEPTSGLDPLVRRQFLERISEFASRERSVLLASHEVEDVERIADVVAILQPNGQFLTAPTKEFKKMIREISFDGDRDTAVSKIPTENFVNCVHEDGRAVAIVRNFDSAAAEALGVDGLQERELSIEEIFLAVMKADPVECLES